MDGSAKTPIEARREGNRESWLLTYWAASKFQEGAQRSPRKSG